MSDNTPEYWKNKGNDEVKLNNFDEGLEFYKKALEIDPDYLPALHNLGMVYKRLGKEKESELYFDREREIENKSGNQFSQDTGLFDRLGNGIKSGTRWMTYRYLDQKQLIHVEKLILDEFDLDGLKKMCLYFNIGSPGLTKIRPSKKHWVDHIMGNISLSKIKEYAIKKNKLTPEIIEIEEKYKKERLEKFPEYENDKDEVLSSISLYPYDKKLVEELVKAIDEYQPVKRFKNEELYHTNLHTYLSEKVSVVVSYEKQRGSSRPDLEVGNIAIEVKGPTDDRATQTIADKMLRYLENYNYIILVLFDVRLTDSRYQDLYNGIIRQYEGQVTIIRKDPIPSEKSLTTPNSTNGYCIRCQDEIPLNPNKPLCQKCYGSWVKYSNGRYTEKYCHICGAISKQSYSKPVCYSCWKKLAK